MAGGKTRRVCKDIPASAPSVLHVPPVLYERKSDSTQTSRSAPRSSTSKTPARVRDTCLRQYEHGSRRDSQISTDEEYVDVAGATFSVAEDEKEPVGSTGGSVFVYSEDDAQDPSSRIPAPPSMELDDGAWGGRVRSSSHRNSEKLDATSNEGPASSRALLSTFPARRSSEGSQAERRSAQGVERGASRQPERSHQHLRPQKQENVRQLEKQPRVREQLLQRVQSGGKRSRVNHTGMSVPSRGENCSGEGVDGVSTGVCITEDNVPKVFSNSTRAAARADTTVNTSASPTGVNAPRGDNSRRGIRGAPGSQRNEAETCRTAVKMSGRKGRVSSYALARGSDGRSASRDARIVAVAQHEPANTQTTRRAHTVDTREDNGENQSFSTPSKEATFLSSVFSSTLSNSFLSLSSSKPHSAGRVSRLRPLQPRATVSAPTLGAPFLLRPANGGDVCDTVPSGVRAAVCSSIVYALSDCVPRRVTASSSQSSPRLHQLLSVEHLPLFRKMVTEAEQAHWQRRQQKVQSIRQQQLHHHHLRRLLAQHTWQRRRSSPSLHETNSDDEVVSDFSPLNDDRRVLRRGSKAHVESVERRRRVCAAADSTWAGRASTARVAAAARTPTFSTLRHVIRARALSRAAAAERQPKHGRASTVGSSTSRNTSSDRASYRSKSRNKPCYLWRGVKQRFTKIMCEDQSASNSATTASCCATSSEATTECSSSRSKQRDFGRRLKGGVSATASGFPSLEARGYQDHSTRPTRASQDSWVSRGRVRPEPCFHSCSPASSERRRPLYRAASSEVRSRSVLPPGRSASRIPSVPADGACMSNTASACAAAPQRLADVLVGPPAAAAATGESSGLTASADSSPAALSYKTAAACCLSEQASTVSSSNAQQQQVFAARGGGAPYVPLSSNDSRSADTALGGNSTELPGSFRGAKHEKKESQHLLPVAVGSSISAFVDTVRPSCPRERYWELYNAYQRGAAGVDSLSRRLHMPQQEQEQQQVLRQQHPHVEQKWLRSRSAFLKNEEPLFRLRTGERNVRREKNFTSSVCVVDHSLSNSFSASAFRDQQWKRRPLELRASAAVQRDTDGAAGGARETAHYVATEADENTSPSPRVTTGAAGILRVPFRTASRSAAAPPAAVSRVAANRCTHGEGEPVDAFQRTRRINGRPATSAGAQLPPSDTAVAAGWKQKEVRCLKQGQQRGGNKHLLQYFHQQLLEHFQQQPHGRERARERDGNLLCCGFSGSSVGANLKRKDRKWAEQQQAVRHGGNAQERHKGGTAFSRDLLTPSASGCSPHSDTAPSPFMRLQLQGRRNDVAGGVGIDGAAGATGSGGGAAVEGACPERVFLERPATLQSAAGAAVATLTAATAPNCKGGGQQRAVPLSATCEDPVAPLTSKAAPATPLQHPLLGLPSASSMTAVPADARSTGALARAVDRLGGAAGGCASGVTLSAPSAAETSLVHATATAAAVSATWPAAGFGWPAGGPTAATPSYSPMRPTNELTHKGIGMDALQQAVVRQQLELHANGDINACSISVVSSPDCDGTRSSSRSKKAAEGDSGSIKALASRRRCMSLFPFATSRAAVATENDAHVARDDRKHPLLSADNKESGNYNKGINGKRDKGTCTGSRSNSGSRNTTNRNSGSRDGGSRSSKSDGGTGEHFKIERSSDRDTKGHTSSDNSYVLLFSQDDGGQGKSSVSIIDSSNAFCGASSHLGYEEESEQRRRGVLFPRRMPTTEAGSGADGTEAAGNVVTSTAGKPDYDQVSSKQHAAASGTVDSRCELFQGARDTIVEKSSVFTYQTEKKPCAEIERKTCCSGDFSHTAKGATETGSERGDLLAERRPTALQLQGDSEASCPVAACRLARAEGGAYEFQGKHCNTGAFHAANAHTLQPGASTAASKTGSPTGAASPAAAIVEEDVAPCAAVLKPRTPTVFVAAAPGTRPPTPAALPAQSANVTRAAVVAATPPSLAAAAAEATLPEAAGGIWARRTPTSVGLGMATAGRSAAGPKATSSASVAAHTTAGQQEASALGTTVHASSAVGGNPEVAPASCEEVSAELSKLEVVFGSGSCHSSPHGGIPEYVHNKESCTYEMHDNKRNREDGTHEYTEAAYNGADTHSDSSLPASAADGMTASSANAAAAFSNSCGCTSSFRGECTHVAYTGIWERPAHADAASASSVPSPGGGSAAAAKAVIAVGADLPGEDRHFADIVERPHRGCPLTSDVHHAFAVATPNNSSLTYSNSVPHGENRSLLASEAGVAEPPSERGSAASAVRPCHGVQHGCLAAVAPCPVTVVTASPAGCGSPESSAPSFYSISSADQHLQKRLKQPTQQQCLVQRPAGHQHPQQQTQQQYQLHQQSRLEQQQDLEHHPQPPHHYQEQKQWQQEQSLRRPVQQQQLQQQLQTLQQPSQVQYLGVQRSLLQEPQQRGSHVSEQPGHEPIQLRQTEQEQHGHQEDEQVGDEVYRPVVMRAALPDSLTATQSTSLFVCSNCSSRSDRSRDSITTATATPSTESLLPNNASVAARSYFKEKAGAAAAGRTVVDGGDVSACAAGATGAGGSRAEDGSVAPGCAGVTTLTNKKGRAELSLMHLCAPGCGRSCHLPEEQQRQTAGGTGRDLRVDARVPSPSSVRAVTAATKTEASSPAKAAVVPVIVPPRSAAFGTKRVAQTRLHCGRGRCFPSPCRSDAELPSADIDNTSRTVASGSLASLPSLGDSCSTEEVCLAQLLTQLLLILQDQPHGSVDAPLLCPGDAAQEQHPAEKGAAAATAGATLTGDDVAGAASTSAHGADVQLHCKKWGVHCKTTSHDCQQAASTSAADGASLPNGSGRLADIVPRNSKSGRCTVSVDDGNSDSSNTGHRSTHGGNVLATTVSNTEIDSCNSAVAGNGNSRVNANFARGSCSTGLAAVQVRPSSPPPRPGGAVLPEVTAAVAESSVQAAAATHPTTETAPPSTAGAPVFTAVAAAPSSAGTAASSITAAAAPTAVVCTLELKNEVTGPTSAAEAAVPTLWRGATGSADVRAGSAGSAQASSAPSSEEAGVQFIASCVQTPTAGTEESRQPSKTPSARSSSVTQAVAVQQPPPSPPAVGEYGRLPLLVEGGGLLKTEAFSECGGTRGAATAAAADLEAPSSASAAAATVGIADRSGSLGPAFRCATGLTIPKALPLSRTLGASADVFAGVIAGARRNEGIFMGSVSAAKRCAAPAVVDADAVDGDRAVNNVGGIPQELAVSQMVSTAEKCLVKGVADACLDSSKQTQPLQPLLLASLLGLLSLDTSMLRPLLPVSPWNGRCLDCTTASEDGVKRGNGTVLAASSQNKRRSRSSCSSCTGSCSHAPQSGGFVNGSAPRSLFLSDTASTSVAPTAAGDWVTTLPSQLQQAAALSLSLLRQLSTSTQLLYSTSRYGSVQVPRQQQLQQPHQRESLSMPQQLPPLQSPHEMPIMAEDSQWETQEQQTRQQLQPSQDVVRCDPHGLTEPAHQQQTTTEEVRGGTLVGENLKSAAPYIVAGKTPTRATATLSGAAVHDRGPGASIVAPGAPAATAAWDVGNAGAFPAVAYSPHYCSAGEGRSLSLSQLQQTTVGSASPQQWEEQRLQLQQQLRQQKLQLEQHQLVPEQEAPAPQSDTQQFLRDVGSSDCAAKSQVCSPLGAGAMQWSEEECRAVARTVVMLHAQQLQKATQGQRRVQPEGRKQQIEQMQAGTSRQVLQVGGSDQGKRHLQAPQQSVKRQDEASTPKQLQGDQQRVQQPWDRQQDRNTQPESSQHHRLLQQELQLQHHPNEGLHVNKTETINTEKQRRDDWNSDGSSSDANVTRKAAKRTTAGWQKNRGGKKTRSARTSNCVERSSHRRHQGDNGATRTSTREHSSSRSGRRRGSSSPETSSRSTTRASGNTVRQKSRTSTFTTTNPGKRCDTNAAPSANRKDRAGRWIGEKSPRRKSTAFLALTHSPDDTVGASAAAARNAPLPEAESARQKTDMVGSYPLSGRISSAHNTDVRLDTVALEKKEERKLETSKLRKKYEDADGGKKDALCAPGVPAAASTFVIESSVTTDVTTTDAATTVARRGPPEVSRLHFKGNEVHSRQQQPPQSERQQRQQRPQLQTRARTRYSLSPRYHHVDDQEGKPTKKRVSNVISCSGRSKLRGVSCENAGTRGAERDPAMYTWSEKALSHTIDSDPVKCDSNTRCKLRSSRRQDSSIQTARSSTPVPRNPRRKNRSTNGNNRGHTKRSSIHEPRSGSRRQVHGSRRHTSSSSRGVERSSRRHASFTRTGRTRWKERVAPISTSPWEVEDAEEQVLPMLRKHLEQQRELQEELQQVEQQLAGLHLLNSLTVFSSGVSCSAGSRTLAETEAQMNAALENSSTYSHKHCDEARGRMDVNASSTCGSDKPMWNGSTCKENSRWSSSSSGSTSYYTPVSVSTASVAAVQRGEGAGAHQVTQSRSLNSSHLVTTEQAAADAHTFPRCVDGFSTAEASHVTIHSSSKSRIRSPGSSRSDSCERIVGREWLGLWGRKVDLAAVKQQLYGTRLSSKRTFSREKINVSKGDISKKASCFFSGSAFYCAADADCTFARKLVPTEPLSPAQTLVGNTAGANMATQEAVRCRSHPGVPDGHGAVAAAENQRKKTGLLQGLPSIQQRQQRLRSHDASQRRSVYSLSSRPGKDVLLFSAAESSVDEATDHLGYKVTPRSAHRVQTSRQRTGTTAHVWPHYGDAGKAAGALASEAANQHREQRRYQQQRLQQLKRSGRNLHTSMLLDSETDGATEKSGNEEDFSPAIPTVQTQH